MSIHRNLPQLNRNVFEQWYETATSLTKIRNVLITQMQPCRSRGRRAPQPPSAKFPLRSEGGGFKLRLKQPNNPVPSSVRQVIGRTLRQLRALIGQATADDLRASYRWTFAGVTARSQTARFLRRVRYDALCQT